VTIGKMTDLGLEWSKGPDLLLGRRNHRSIIIGNVIYHVGGSGNMLVLLFLLNYFNFCLGKLKSGPSKKMKLPRKY